MSKKNKKEVTLEQFAKAHKVVSKKALIIGSICAGTVALGGAGAAVYFGVTRGSTDNSISYAEANEFAEKNYTLTEEDVEKNGKADIKNATISWDFSKTEGIDDTETEGKSGYIFKNLLFSNIIKPILADQSVVASKKAENLKIAESYYTYQTVGAEVFLFIDTYTIYGLENVQSAFYSEEYYNLKKVGDNISYSKQVNITTSISDTVDCTLNKNGTVKKVYMPIYGSIIGDELFNASITFDFNY